MANNKNKNKQNPQSNQQESPKENNVNKAIYDKYVGLKFVALSGTKLKDETKSELAELEKQVSEMIGTKALKTVRAAIQNEQVLLVKDMPIPAEYLQIIYGCNNPSHYIEIDVVIESVKDQE